MPAAALAQYAQAPAPDAPGPVLPISSYAQNSQAFAHNTQPSNQNLQGWRFDPSIALLETFTNNVNLTPSVTARSDLVTQITPQLAFSEKSARTSLHGVISAPVLLYARTGSENNQVYPAVDLVGQVEALEKFLFVEGAVDVSQQYFNPFGAQPQDLTNATQNRYTSQVYRVTPYIQGVTPGDIKYELRNNNVWTNLNNAPTETSNYYLNEWVGNVSSPVTPFGWAVDFDRTDIDFQDQRPTKTQLERATLRFQADPLVRFDIDAGYEDNQYPFAEYSGAIYGVGVHWNPTERTKVTGTWEHRFFGSSYLLDAEHRTPLSAILIHASRNTSSYPQQFLSLPATGNLPLLLDFLLQSQIPDPLQRQNAIQEIQRDRGLPDTLTSPINLYAQQTYLLENASVTYGILGARNSIYVNGFYLRSEPITGAGTPLAGILALSNNNTQTGGSVTWIHNLTAMMTLNAACTEIHTKANAPLVGTTKERYCTLGVVAPVSAKTTLSIGGRYQTLRSDVSPDYDEAAVFVGLNYLFK